MKIIATSTLGLALCIASFFLFASDSEVSAGLSHETVQPALSKTAKETPSPTPSCSPQSTPKSKEEKNSPLRELTLEEIVDLGVGTPDFDCDGVCNFSDNCLSVFNPDQKDSNANGKGDACDLKIAAPFFTDSRCDEDGDGVPDIKDNCPSACNPDQKFVDINKNNVNDLCDSALPSFTFNKPCAKRKKVKPPRPPQAVKKELPTFKPGTLTSSEYSQLKKIYLC